MYILLKSIFPFRERHISLYTLHRTVSLALGKRHARAQVSRTTQKRAKRWASLKNSTRWQQLLVFTKLSCTYLVKIMMTWMYMSSSRSTSSRHANPNNTRSSYFYKESVGILLASHRAVDESKSINPHWLRHPHDTKNKIEPATNAKLDIGIWAFGIGGHSSSPCSGKVEGHLCTHQTQPQQVESYLKWE